MTYAYLQDGEAVGFLGIANYQKRSIKINKDVLIELMGSFGGKMAYKPMSAALEKLNTNSPDEVYIDYIAASPEHRSKGIGTKLIEYVRDNLGYKYLMLEVFTKNPRAKELYERLGFKTVKVSTHLIVLIQGFGRLITMRMDVNGG
jgi:ribosomal protein S18 acetylase RimI-like enzyme